MTWRELSTELKVGLFVLACVGVIAFGWVWSYDGLRRSEGGYHVQMTVPSADGLYPGSLVKIAGVEVGAIDAVSVEGNRAHLLMTIKSDYPLPTDSTASLGQSMEARSPGRPACTTLAHASRCSGSCSSPTKAQRSASLLRGSSVKSSYLMVSSCSGGIVARSCSSRRHCWA